MKSVLFACGLLASMTNSSCADTSSLENKPVNAAPSYQTSTREILTMNDAMPTPSRPAPPKVDPITHKGVRYEQDMQSSHYGGTQLGGYLVAIEPATGERLWMLKVYENPTQADAPFQPGRYFRSMRLLPETDEIEIESEVGGKYIVDLSKRTAVWISGPDSVHK
jgi:hypothetical protein